MTDDFDPRLDLGAPSARPGVSLGAGREDRRRAEYLKYHAESARVGDIDPSYSMLRYLCDRYELNVEQRYWIAWLYSMTYCGASAFYIYNEFPDYECVDLGRLERWWADRGRDQVICQTDRRWVRSSSQFVPAFLTYRSMIRQLGETQAQHFDYFSQKYATPEERYRALYDWSGQMYSFGQFALFLYLEALHTVTPIDLCPTDLDLDRAWSCRNGLYYAYGRDDIVHDAETRIVSEYASMTEDLWRDLQHQLSMFEKPPTVWQTETMLCAFRKWKRGKRYIGFYLDRQASEIAKMANKVRRGIHWEVLWQYRSEVFSHEYLAEREEAVDERGVRKSWIAAAHERTRRLLEDC
jgi:hypothetical protein